MVNTDDCWHWARYTNKLGYGLYTVKIHGKWRSRSAHRLMYETMVSEIPEGLVLDHLCRVPTCINPIHLEAVTSGENVRRGDAVKLHSSKTHCPKGHPYSGANLKQTKVGKYIYRHCRACARAHRNEHYARTGK